jgi:anti-anti-sigma factor
MTIEETLSGDVTILRLEGELDMRAAPALKTKLDVPAARERPRAIVNLERLSYVDSAGLGVLIAALKTYRGKGGALVLVGPQPTVRHVLEITRLSQHFPIHGSESEALAALR